MAISWKTDVGLNHVGAYQVSGRPFVTGGVNAATTTKVEFPATTRWLYVLNQSTDPVRVGFSQNGVENNNFFEVSGNGGTSAVLELKIGELWLSGSNYVQVVAGLTNIDSSRTSGSIGPSWSGSVGVG